MSDVAIGAIGLTVAIVIMLIGFPIGISFFAGGILGLGLLVGFEKAVRVMASVPYDTFTNYVLMAVPMFILMGRICMGSGISRGLYDFAHRWLGHLPGGLAIATIGACGMFSAVTGSSMACAGAIGSIAMPEMSRYNYNRSLAAGAISAGGTLGILIPPSMAFIWIGILTGTNISKLFIAGIVPGIMLAAMYMVTTYIMIRIKPSLGPPGRPAPGGNASSLPGALPA
ncbi:MAG: TRAP transporter large permease subunit [Chloroflexota bacterium]